MCISEPYIAHIFIKKGLPQAILIDPSPGGIGHDNFSKNNSLSDINTKI